MSRLLPSAVIALLVGVSAAVPKFVAYEPEVEVYGNGEGKQTTEQPAPKPPPEQVTTPQPGAEEPEIQVYGARSPRAGNRHGVIHAMLLYIPNRVLDMLDIVRFRVRIGPGIAAGVRATDTIDFFAGSYLSAYVGLPGPRMAPIVKPPAGAENYSGVEISHAEFMADLGSGPDYSPTEFGASAHALLLGADVGIDPVEVVDLLLGLLFIDLRQDDF